MMPADDKVRPDGNEPLTNDQVGDVQFDSSNVCLYDWSTVALGKDLVVIWQLPGAALMVMLSVCVTWLPPDGVTPTVNEEVPAVVGVPLMTPADDKLRPAGNAPLTNAQVGGVQFDSDNV